MGCGIFLSIFELNLIIEAEKEIKKALAEIPVEPTTDPQKTKLS